jgi:hypothetical protein
MSEWDWFHDYEMDARLRGDEARLRMATVHHEAYDLREIDPHRALALYEEGHRLARTFKEPWWTLFYDHWRATALLFFLRDFSGVLDLAVRATLEARKPQYQQFPFRFSVQRNLISAYLGIDPAGYAGVVSEALAYLEGEISREGEDKYLLQGSKAEYAFERGDWETARRMCEQSLAWAAVEDDRGMAEHTSVFDYSMLCEVEWKVGDWTALAEHADVGEGLARRVGHTLELSEFLLWQALLARRAGDEARARRLCRRATGRVSRMRMPPDVFYHDALCAYYEANGDLERSLQARDEELALLRNKGRIAYEARVHVHRCRLLARLERLSGDEVTVARAAADRLRDPAPYHAELEEIAQRGEGD